MGILDEFDAEDLQMLVASREGLDHIVVKKHGKSLKLMSEGPDRLEPHARFTRIGRDRWRLDLPSHTGRWEQTPFSGSMDELLDTLIGQLGWHLEPHR